MKAELNEHFHTHHFPQHCNQTLRHVEYANLASFLLLAYLWTAYD
jgi:hypothetical protein